ncbi:MAG: hypothetical protein MZW92_77970 [Comamonadaceae bacterium]|nr:hypothetical protein [Comamonadaceae bacterium]
MATTQRTSDCVPLDWKEVYYTNCPLVSASNVDQELGWTREEFKKIGVKYAFLRSAPREQLVSALHPQPRQPDPLRRPVPADPRSRRHPPDPAAGGDARAARRRLHDGARPRRHLPDEGSEGQEDRPLEEPEHDQERLVAHPGAPGHRADAPAERHDHGRRRDRRVPLPGRLVRRARDARTPMDNPSELWLQARPQARPGLPPAGDGAAEKGIVDAIYTQSKPFQHLQEATGKFKAIEDLSRYPDWTPAGGQHPRRHHLHRRDGREAPRARRHVHEGHDQGRALGQRAQARRGGDPRQADVLPGRRGHLPGHQGRRHGAQPVAAEPGLRRDRQGLHAEPRLHQERLRRAEVGRAGVPRAGGEGTARRAVEEGDHGQASRVDVPAHGLVTGSTRQRAAARPQSTPQRPSDRAVRTRRLPAAGGVGNVPLAAALRSAERYNP